MLRTSGMKNELIITFVVPNRIVIRYVRVKKCQCWTQDKKDNAKCFIHVFCICINMRHVS